MLHAVAGCVGHRAGAYRLADGQLKNLSLRWFDDAALHGDHGDHRAIPANTAGFRD